MIIGAFGNLSSGKTATCVKYCYENLQKGKKIISNIKLNFEYKHLELDELFEIAFSDNVQYKKEFFFKTILFIDEIHNIIDARRSNSQLNTKFTQFVTQIGKLDCTLLFTSQIFSSQVDLRVREMCNVIITCFRTDDKGKLLVFEDRISQKNVYIWCIMEVLFFGVDSKDNPKTMYSYNPKDIFEKYDTREIVLLDRDKYLKK